MALIEFPHGLIGLPGTRYALLAPHDGAAFMRLESVDEPGLAIPVADPFLLFESYAIELSCDEAERIPFSASDATAVYVTLRIADETGCLMVNLRAPLLVSAGTGYQVINQDPGAPLRAPLSTLASSTPRRNPCSSLRDVPAKRSCSATTSLSR